MICHCIQYCVVAFNCQHFSYYSDFYAPSFTLFERSIEISLNIRIQVTEEIPIILKLVEVNFSIPPLVRDLLVEQQTIQILNTTAIARSRNRLICVFPVSMVNMVTSRLKCFCQARVRAINHSRKTISDNMCKLVTVSTSIHSLCRRVKILTIFQFYDLQRLTLL